MLAGSDGVVGRQRAGAPVRGVVELALEGRGRLVAREREGRGRSPGRGRRPEEDLGLGRIALDDHPRVVGRDGVRELVRHEDAHVEGVGAERQVAVVLRRDAEREGARVERALVAEVAPGRLEGEAGVPVLGLRLRRAARDGDGRCGAADLPREHGGRQVEAVADLRADAEVVGAEDDVRVGDARGARRPDLVVEGRVERALEGRAGQVGVEGEGRGLVVRGRGRRAGQERVGHRHAPSTATPQASGRRRRRRSSRGRAAGGLRPGGPGGGTASRRSRTGRRRASTRRSRAGRSRRT